MNYYIDLFTPETAKAFVDSGKKVSGFRASRKTYIKNQKIGPEDKFICYVVRLQRLIGVLKNSGKYYEDNTPLFVKEDDPFVLRFNVEPVVWLSLENAIPIHEDIIWKKLSFTKHLDKDDNKWTHMVFSSPRLWPKADCELLEKILIDQSRNPITYPFTDADQKKLKSPKIRLTEKKEVAVSIPEEEESISVTEDTRTSSSGDRESRRIQAALVEIGEKLGFTIWLPRADRDAVLAIWEPKRDTLLEDLPFTFIESAQKTIKNIDVLWIKKRTIVRAFEVEGTTSIYSGILRMADLFSLVPNINIKFHIVAPDRRRDEVFKQISRPVFAAMETGPLSELCSYISYSSINELSKEKRLQHMTETVIDDYSEFSDL